MDGHRDADVIVVGLGTMGSAAAEHLAARGADVLGFERFGRGHDMASHGGGSRIIRMSYFEHPAYVPLLARAFELWEELDAWARERGDEPIVHMTGGVYAGPPTSETFAGSRISAVTHRLEHEVLDAAETAARYPELRLGEGEQSLHEARAGFVRPEATVAAQLARAEASGARLRFDEKVLAVMPRPDGSVAVETETGGYVAGHVVVCAGAWSPGIFADARIPQFAERQVMYWFDPGDAYGEFARMPVYVHEGAAGAGAGACTDGGGALESAQIYGFPASDGREAGAKVAFFRRGGPVDPDQLDREVHDDEIADMRRRLRVTVPALADGALVKAKACMYTVTPDHHFVIGAHPLKDGVTIACGFSGHGFKFAPVVGEILADLALDGATAHDIGLFDPMRFTEVRAAVEEAGAAAPAGAPSPSSATAPSARSSAGPCRRPCSSSW